MLYQLGTVQFDVAPVNLHSASRKKGADFAAKDIVGAKRPHEFMGEADETISLKGRLFPHRFGGLDGLAALQAMAAAGEPQMLVRGDGDVIGWVVVESVEEDSGFLDRRGVGRVIEFSISMKATPRRASADGMMATLFSLFG